MLVSSRLPAHAWREQLIFTSKGVRNKQAVHYRTHRLWEQIHLQGEISEPPQSLHKAGLLADEFSVITFGLQNELELHS